jgi:hypothetical protein
LVTSGALNEEHFCNFSQNGKNTGGNLSNDILIRSGVMKRKSFLGLLFVFTFLTGCASSPAENTPPSVRGPRRTKRRGGLWKIITRF